MEELRMGFWLVAGWRGDYLLRWREFEGSMIRGRGVV